MTTSTTSVNSSTTAQLLIAADPTRSSLTIQNDDENEMFLGNDAGVLTTLYAFRRVYGTGYTFSPPESYQAWYGIWDLDGTGGANITAITDPVVDDNGSISTYGELKTALAAWLKPNTALPTDETTSRIPEYIALFEAEANRTLRIRHMDSVETALTITNGAATIPTGFREIKSFRLTDYPYNEVRYLPIDQIEALDPTNTSLPYYYDIVGANIITYPPTSATARMRYRSGLTPLASTNDTNWLLAKHPDAYLFGSLKQADIRYVDPERAPMVERRYNAAMSQIIDEQNMMIGSAIMPQPAGFVV